MPIARLALDALPRVHLASNRKVAAAYEEKESDP